MHSQYRGVDVFAHRIGFPPKSEMSNGANSHNAIIYNVVAIAAIRIVVLKDSFIASVFIILLLPLFSCSNLQVETGDLIFFTLFLSCQRLYL